MYLNVACTIHYSTTINYYNLYLLTSHTFYPKSSGLQHISCISIFLIAILHMIRTCISVLFQDTFWFLGGKLVNTSIRWMTGRHLFLFQRLLLITKKKEDHCVYK